MLAERILCLGVNHKTAPVEIREKLAAKGDCANPFAELLDGLGCEEACLLSTCNRVEILAVSDQPERASKTLREYLFSPAGVSMAEAERYSYLHQGKEAVRHVFRVASSLDSMVVGEPQILGQLKDAYRKACEHNATGPVLNRLVTRSFSVAKRIRTETNIGSAAVSISFAAVQLARKIFGDLSGKKVLLVGAGEMAELAAEHLVAQGVAEVVVANRTRERAVDLARLFHGRAVGLSEIGEQLAEVDILISSTGAPGLVLHQEDVRPIMRRRHHRPLFLIDIAVPRDLDPRINDLDNIYLYDIDDLKQVVELNKAGRQKEAAKAERIVEEETVKFVQWLGGMELTPTIKEIRAWAETIRAAELERTLPALAGLSDKERRSVERMTMAIVNKMLHHPMQFLKHECSPARGGRDALALVRRVFGLDTATEDRNLADGDT